MAEVSVEFFVNQMSQDVVVTPSIPGTVPPMTEGQVNTLIEAAIPADTGLIIPVTTPASTWNLVHDLPFRPQVQITDSAGNVVYPDNIRHIDATHIQVTFSATFAGEASLT